jgi:dTDP-4-dehydrorhamnose reductase
MNQERPKILVLGASGGIGSMVHVSLHDTPSYDVTGTYFQNQKYIDLVNCDITDLESLKRVIGESKPDTILNFAAIAQEKLCKENPDKARRVNIEGVQNSVRLASDYNLPYLYPSSVNIFAGYNNSEICDEEAIPRPKDDSVYAQNKIEAEKIVKQSTSPWAIFRTDLVLAPHHGIAKLIEDNQYAKITINGPRFPVYKKDFMEKVTSFIENPSKFSGITHLISPEFRLGFKLANIADTIITRFNLAKSTVMVPCSTEFIPRSNLHSPMPIYITPDANQQATQKFFFTSTRL